MNTYEAMFLIDDKLDEKSAEGVLEQAKEMITKEGGEIISSRLWTDKRKLTFPIKKKEEARYYLVNFKLQPDLIDKLKETYRLNENVLRVLITRSGQ